MQQHKYHVFLSHSKKDVAMMQTVREELEALGLEVWVDETGLIPGEPSWRRAIETAINQSGCVIALASSDAKESKWVENELLFAENSQKPVVMVLIRGTERESIPFGYLGAQFIDLREQSEYPYQMRRLINAIGKHIPIPDTTAYSNKEDSLILPLDASSVTTIEVSFTGIPLPFKRFDAWNPIYQARYLYWLFAKPRQLLAFQDAVGKKSANRLGRALLNNLLWFPLISLTFAAVVGSLPAPTSNFFTQQLENVFTPMRQLANVAIGYAFTAYMIRTPEARSTRFLNRLIEPLAFVGGLILIFSFGPVGLIGAYQSGSIPRLTTSFLFSAPYLLSNAMLVALPLGMSRRFGYRAVGFSIALGIILQINLASLAVEGFLALFISVFTAFTVAIVVRENIVGMRASLLSKLILAFYVVSVVGFIWVAFLGGYQLITSSN